VTRKDSDEQDPGSAILVGYVEEAEFATKIDRSVRTVADGAR
jgi:hypothetical protein